MRTCVIALVFSFKYLKAGEAIFVIHKLPLSTLRTEVDLKCVVISFHDYNR